MPTHQPTPQRHQKDENCSQKDRYAGTGYGHDTSLRFDVQRRPTPGSVRVLPKDRRELLHLAADRDAAEKWAAANYANAVFEDVTETEADESEEVA